MDEPLIVISSDGHAGARMEEYRPYLDAEFREEFDGFVGLWNEKGSRNFDPPALRQRISPEFVDEWIEKMVDTGRVEGFYDASKRLDEVEREGVTAEVLFPDFGLPFELYSAAGLASALGYPALDAAHRRAGYRAFNRWLPDYMSVAPERFAGMGIVAWEDPADAVAEIRRIHRAGLKGIVLPEFAPDVPMFDERFEPIWDTLEELGMIVNSHSGFSSTTDRPILTQSVPHPACASRVFLTEMAFGCHNVLSHLIWGAVLERHPGLSVVFTEQGTGWVVPALRSMDWTYERSHFRRDFKEVITHKPSEYFARQCFMGSSLFSTAEVEQRHEIGLEKMMLGMDFPHHEGTMLETTQAYLRATLGEARVPVAEARRLLGENAAAVFGFDLAALAPLAARVGLDPATVLEPPETELFAYGDVHRPISTIYF